MNNKIVDAARVANLAVVLFFVLIILTNIISGWYLIWLIIAQLFLVWIVTFGARVCLVGDRTDST